MAKKALYVAAYEEQLRDGCERGAKIFASIDEATAWINTLANGFCGDARTFGLWELGARIDLAPADVETPQPPKVERKFQVAADGKKKTK